MPTTIKMPSSLTVEAVFTLSRQLKFHLQNEEDHYIIDFSDFKNAPPFGILFTSQILNDFIKFASLKFADKDTYIEYKNFKDKRFHAHFGFFKASGINYGSYIPDSPGNHQYLPIDCIEFDLSNTEESQIARENLADSIKKESRRLATVLIRDDAGDIFDNISYSFIEIFRNTIEHSKTNSIWYAAQFWPKMKRAEIAVLDKGIGIFNSLAENTNLQLKDESHALALALHPGISRLGVNKTAYSANPTGIGNAGYGLYMISQIFGSGNQDSFFMASGKSSVSISGGRVSQFNIPHFSGTALRLKFDINNISELESRLFQLNQRASTIANAPLSGSASATGRVLFQ